MKSKASDIELIKKLQRGDEEAFCLIYLRYSGALYKFGLKYLRSALDSEELVQSVFLKVWENHKKLDPDLSFRAFLFTIAYNDICKIFRKRKFYQKFISDGVASIPDSSNNTEEEIQSRSIEERINTAIDRLPERQRVIFLKSRTEGKSTKEIAEELKLSPGTVDNYVSQGLKSIKKLCKKDLPDYLIQSFLLFSLFY